MFLHFLFILLYLIGSVTFSGKILSVLLIAHCVFAMYEYLRKKKNLDPLFFYIIHVIIVTVANIVIIGEVETLSVSAAYNYIIPEKIDISTLLWAIGNTFIFIGYEVFSKRSLPSIAVNITTRKKLKTLFWIMLAAIFRQFVIKDVVLGSFAVVIIAFSSVGILFFARLWTLYNDKQYRNYALILYTTQTIMALMYAFLRTDIILPTVSLFIGYFLGKKDIKQVFSYRAIPFAILLFLFNSFFSFFGANRADISTGFMRLQQLQQISKVESNFEEEDKQNVIERLSVLPQLTNIVNLVDANGLYKGKASAPLLIALIPRVLWPEKPLISLGSWFAFQIGQSPESDTFTYTNSIDMTIPGHLFLDFGWIWAILGCFLVGGLVSSIWNATGFYESPYNISGVILGGFIIITAFQGIGADLQITITLLAIYMIFLIFKRVVNS